MSLTKFQLDLLDTLEKQLSGALRAVSLIRNRYINKEWLMEKPSLYDSYTINKTCTNTCDDILKSLPKLNQGRNRHENLTGLHPGTIQEVQKVKRLDDFARYEACKELLTDKQYIAVYLRYHEGKTQQEIADILGKGRTTISDLLNRAEKTKDEYYKKLRTEKAEFMKKEIEKNEG